MKLAILTALYRDALRWFYQNHKGITEQPFEIHRQAVDDHVSLWAGAWQRALTKEGFDVLTFPLNDNALLNAWANTNGVKGISPESIVIEMLRRFKPDVLWYDSVNAQLLKALKGALPSLHLVLSWTGSAVVAYDVFRECDVVLSCAPEAVTKLRNAGMPVYQLHHAFDPHWLVHTKAGKKLYDVTFVGQIVRGAAFHIERERLLKQIARDVDLSFFSPTHIMGIRDILKTLAIQTAYSLITLLKKFGLSARPSTNAAMRKILDLSSFPRFPYDGTLKDISHPPVFGTAMLEILAESRIVLNIHADTSPDYASNMRLFETTGVGSLLLTEQRRNISELFFPGDEIVTYENTGDCLEKIRWLSSHREESAAIARRGMNRTHKDHSFDRRAGMFCEIVRKHLHK